MPDLTDIRRPTVPTAASAMAGDRSAMECLWHENRRWIAAVILVHKPANADLEDLLQEVAMTLVAKINTLRNESNVKAWLRAVAVNVSRAAGRTTRDRSMSVLEPDAVEHLAGSASAPNDHAQRALEAAQRLPEGYREPLMLRAVQGLRTRQIAQILGIEVAAVDTRISRARRMLREELALIEQDSSESAEPARRATLNGKLTHTRLEVQP